MTLEEQIQQKIEALKEIQKLEEYLSFLKDDILEAESDLFESLKILEQEYKDVEALEERTTTMLFHKLRGTLDEQLEKEKEEYYEAFLQTKEARKAIDLLEFEEKVIYEKFLTLKANEPKVRSELQKLLNNREKELAKFDKTRKSRIREFNKKLDDHHRMIKDMQEAIDLCFNMMRDLNDLHRILTSMKQRKLLYSLSKGAELRESVQEASLAYRKLNNKRKRLKNELRQLFKRMPNNQIKALIRKSNAHSKLIKHVIPPEFLDHPYNQANFRRVSLLNSLEEIRKMVQHMEELYEQLKTELDYLLLLHEKIKEDKANALMN